MIRSTAAGAFAPAIFSQPAKVWLVGVFALMQLADVLTTNHVLAKGGWEANPLQAMAMTHLGPFWWLGKVALVLFVATTMPFVRRLSPYVFVVCWYACILVINALSW